MNGLLLLVRLGGQRVAVRAELVESVAEIEAVTPVPRAAPHVAGLAALRSRVLTVIDCQALLGSAPHTQPAPRDVIIVVADGHGYALLVDGVDDVVAPEGEIVPVGAKLSPEWARIALGMVEAEKDLLLVVDPLALIAGREAAAAS